MTKAQHIKQSCEKNLFPHRSTSLEKHAHSSATYLEKGELSLLQGDLSGLKFFDIATKLDPKNAEIFYRQGLSLLEYSSDKHQTKELLRANRCFKHAAMLKPNYFNAWHAWANTLYLLGIQTNEKSYFFNAKNKYEQALSLCQNEVCDVLGELYSNCGDLWKKLAEYSGEALDLKHAFEFYHQATTCQDNLPVEFWLNFGQVCMKLGYQTNEHRFYMKAIYDYQNAIKSAPSSYQGWFLLAQALSEIYRSSHNEDHASQANQYYHRAIDLQPENSSIWTEWAHLLLEVGQINQDKKMLTACIEKCDMNLQYHPRHILSLHLRAAALATLGLLKEELEPIVEAERIMQQQIEQLHTPDAYYFYGFCLNALATYFNDLDLYYLAIEQFQAGLSIDRTHHKLWHQMGKTYLQTTHFDDDEKNYIRACRFFYRALHLNATSTYHADYANALLQYGEYIQDETHLKSAAYHFEYALDQQKNALYIHPDWLFSYATTLDLIGDYSENEENYETALRLLNHILTVHPTFPNLHYRFALIYQHLGELTCESEYFESSFHHYRISHQKDKENARVVLDWGAALMHLAALTEDHAQARAYFQEAEFKLSQAARLGHAPAYFALACFYSILENYPAAIDFLEKAWLYDDLLSLEEVLENEWLDGLRKTKEFDLFFSKIDKTEKSQST